MNELLKEELKRFEQKLRSLPLTEARTMTHSEILRLIYQLESDENE